MDGPDIPGRSIAKVQAGTFLFSFERASGAPTRLDRAQRQAGVARRAELLAGPIAQLVRAHA